MVNKLVPCIQTAVWRPSSYYNHQSFSLKHYLSNNIYMYNAVNRTHFRTNFLFDCWVFLLFLFLVIELLLTVLVFSPFRDCFIIVYTSFPWLTIIQNNYFMRNNFMYTIAFFNSMSNVNLNFNFMDSDCICNQIPAIWPNGVYLILISINKSLLSLVWIDLVSSIAFTYSDVKGSTMFDCILGAFISYVFHYKDWSKSNCLIVSNYSVSYESVVTFKTQLSRKRQMHCRLKSFEFTMTQRTV